MKFDRRFISSVAGTALIAVHAFGSPPFEVSGIESGQSELGRTPGICPDAVLQEIAFDASDVLRADETFAGFPVPLSR